MYMIPVMVPFINCNVVSGSNVLKDFRQTYGNRVVYDFPTVFDNKDKMVIQTEY